MAFGTAEDELAKRYRKQDHQYIVQSIKNWIMVCVLGVLVLGAIYIIREWYQDTGTLKTRMTILEVSTLDFRNSVEKNFEETMRRLIKIEENTRK